MFKTKYTIHNPKNSQKCAFPLFFKINNTLQTM